jgi:CBS domain containing-hemolysin-like protein
VVFSVSAAETVAEFFARHESVRFSRIPVYRNDRDALEGFVLRSDLLLAKTKGQGDMRLEQFKRPLPVLPDSLTLARAFDRILRERAHIVQIVDEYGCLAGILTLEDIIETLLGLEIVDEGDKAVDMQEYARRQWRRRARKLGLTIES